ncbi:MAG: antibiotic biosynthesis monooxygenase family protein [Ginsengibacter sp.]
MEQIFIDKFFVPGNAKAEFEQQMNINRHFIKKLPGFIRDDVYERTDENGNFFYVTVAVWANEEAIQNAKNAVQVEYQEKGFDMAGMLKRLNILIDRGVYKQKID